VHILSFGREGTVRNPERLAQRLMPDCSLSEVNPSEKVPSTEYPAPQSPEEIVQEYAR